MKRFEISSILLMLILMMLFSVGCAEIQQPTLAAGSNTTTAGDIEATAIDGRKVILHSNGTWIFKASVSREKMSSDITKPPQATEVLKSQKGFYEIWFNPKKWTLDRNPRNPEAEFTLTHATKEAMVMVIAERIGGTISGLKEVAIANAKAAAPDSRVVFEKERIVNGTQVLNMRIDGSIKGIAFSYYGYYWAGEAGLLQVVAYTGANLFDEFQQDFSNFLNGLVVLKN